MGIKYNLPVTNNAFAAMLETGDSFLLQATATCGIFAVPTASGFFREETA